MLRILFTLCILFISFNVSSQTIQFKTFDKFCANSLTIVLDSYVNLNNGKWELISFNDSSSGTSEYAAALARMVDSTKIKTSLAGKYHWRYSNPNGGSPLQDSIYMNIRSLPDLSSVRNPTPKCFDGGQFDLGAETPIGSNFDSISSSNYSTWFTMVDKRRDTMISKVTSSPHWYYTHLFYNQNNNSVPSTGCDSITLHSKIMTTGCEDSTRFKVCINPNPTVFLQNLIRCQDAGCFRLNPAAVRAPSNPDAGIYSWKIVSAPAGLTNFELSQILEDRDPSPFFKDYWFCPNALNTNIQNPPKGAGTYKLLFCYTEGTTNCQTCDTAYITIESLPAIQFSPFDKFCYSDDTIQLDDYVNLPEGRWELISFNGSSSGIYYNAAVARMIDSTAINVKDPTGVGGTYYWRYVNVKTGCPVKDSISMDVSAQPRLELTIDDTLCFSDTLFDLSPFTTTDLVFAFGAPGTGFYGSGVVGNHFNPKAVAATSETYSRHQVYAKYLHPVTTCPNVDSSEIYIENKYPFKTTVYQNGNILYSLENNASYQWYDCDSNRIIAGETKNSFNPTRKGSYKVLLSYSDCNNSESNCFAFNIANINQLLEQHVSIFPNPIHSKLNIKSDDSYLKIKGITILTPLGQIVWSGNNTVSIPFNHPSGIYFIKIETNHGMIVKKVVK